MLTMAIIRWAPRRSSVDLFDDFQRFWDDLVPSHWENRESMWQPRVDINETKDAVNVTAEVPGLTEKDIKITVKDNHLVISGEKKIEEEHKDDNYYCCERRYGKFERVFVVPTEVDPAKAEAKVKDGILKIKLPKTEKVKAKEISVKAE